MKLKNPIFSPQTKLAGMLDRDPSLLDVLERMGIRLGFGESTLGEAAERAGLDPETTCLGAVAPDALVDAILAKRNTGTRRDDAPVVIALGPGFPH